MLRTLFYQRRDVLKSRSALLAVDALVHSHRRPGSDAVAGEVEEIVASAHPFNELRVLAAVPAGWVNGRAEVVAELERLIGGAGGDPRVRLSVAPMPGQPSWPAPRAMPWRAGNAERRVR